MTEKQIAAIFGPSETGQTNELVQSVSLTLQIPQFQTFWNRNLATFVQLGISDGVMKANEVFNFNLYPNPQTLSKAFAALVRQNDWKSYTVIYENDDGLARFQQVFAEQNAKDPPVAYRKLGVGPDHR